MAGGGAERARRAGQGPTHPGRQSPPAGRRRPEEVQRITTAPVGQRQHQQQQIGRYLVSMGIRTACFVLFVVTYVSVGSAWSWGFLAAAVVLPYIAVLAANAGRETVSPTTTGVTPAAARSLGAPRPQEPVVGEVYRPEERQPADDERPPAPQGAADAGTRDDTAAAEAARTVPGTWSTGDPTSAHGPGGWRGAA
ncbi:DUF3099 domain-containing protein [Pseudokineococcus basanitobsidens]|uniref:DUF3099 domain-containing protein n=1 Tax=Pseudokineococcus basanitobsidens TaxID=1926649 RepID=A0ABU8RLT1_9ACTN